MPNKNNISNIIIPLFLSIIGFFYLTYYIFRASIDVIASDYIRIINYYVKDVTNLRYLLSWEGISCIPFTFLARYINVKCFNYSVFFDKILGLFGLVLFNFVTVKYVLENIKNKHLKIITSIIITFISFSLMSWEMILNGTGYPHLITIGLIALTFYLFSRNNSVGAATWSPQAKPPVGASYASPQARLPVGVSYASPQAKLPVGVSYASPQAKLPVGVSYASPVVIVLTSLLFAGSYSVAYLVALILVSLTMLLVLLVNRKKLEASKIVGASYASPIVVIVISLICLALYFKSANSGEQLTPVGFQDVTLRDIMEADATFPIRFMLSSFASALIGVETLTFAAVYGTMTMDAIFIFGLIYVLIMIWTLFIVISNYKENARAKRLRALGVQSALGVQCEPEIFPYLYIIYSLISFALVFFARYKFVRADYGMSSRYAIQYMFLTIGMIIILSKKIDASFTQKNALAVLISSFCIFILFFGHVITTTDEMYKTSNRKLVYEYVREVATNYRDYTDDQLMATFEYFRSPEHIKDALGTLEEKDLNIFKDK